MERDLGIPNLRFVVGELAVTNPEAFRDAQWEVARTTPNTDFIFASDLTTPDGTHFDTSSVINHGEGLGHAFLPDCNVLILNNRPARPATLIGRTISLAGKLEWRRLRSALLSSP